MLLKKADWLPDTVHGLETRLVSAEAIPQRETLSPLFRNPGQDLLGVFGHLVATHQVEDSQRVIDERGKKIEGSLNAVLTYNCAFDGVHQDAVNGTRYSGGCAWQLRTPVLRVVKLATLAHQDLNCALEDFPGIVRLRRKR